MASIITALTILAANSLIVDGVDGADAADMNGAAAKAVYADDGTAALVPSNIVLTVQDYGHDAAGNLLLPGVGGPVRTIKGTVKLRKQWPNQGQRLDSAAGGTRTTYFALSGPIYANSVIVDAQAEAGYYNGAAAGTIGGVVNSSGRAYPKPCFGWLNVQHDRATGNSVYVEAEVTHRWGQSGRMAACVKFQAKDSQGSPNASAIVTVAASTLSTLCKQGNIPEVFAANVPMDGSGGGQALTQGDLCFVNATVYPWLGNAASRLDLLTDGVNTAGAYTTPYPETPLRFVCDRTGGYGGARAYVRPTGTATSGDSSKVFTADQAYGLSNAQCFANPDAAAAAIAAYNQANKGHNDVGGSRVYFTDDGAGGAVVHTSLAHSRTAGQAWLDYRKDPNAVGAVSFSLTTAQSVSSRTRIMLNGAHTVQNGLNGSNVAGKMLAFEEMTLDQTGSSAAVPIHFANPLIFYRNVTFINPIAGFWSPFNGADTGRCPLILGCVDGAVATNRVLQIGYTILGNTFKRVNVTGDVATNPQDRCIWMNNRFNQIIDANRRDLGLANPLTRFGIVQNVWEDARASNGGALFGLSGDGGNVTIDDVLFAFNTFPSPDITGRFNVGYADTAVQKTKRIAQLYNLMPGEWNCKSDTCSLFSSASGRNGNWDIRYGLEAFGNVWGKSTNGETATDQSGGVSPTGAWIGEYLDPSNKLGGLTVTFTDYKSGTGGAGNGTYSLTGLTNDAYARVPAGKQMLAFDMAGVARRNDGTGAAGAYETTVNPPLSGSGSGAVAAPGGGGAGKVAVQGGGSGAVPGPAGSGSGGMTPITGTGGGSVGAPGASGAGVVTVAPITDTGPIISPLQHTISPQPVPSGGSTLTALPLNAEVWNAPFDPSDRTPYAIDWSALLIGEEKIAQIDRITMSAQGASLGIEVDATAGRSPIISTDRTKTEFWFACAAGFQSNAAFSGGGVQIGVSVLIRTDANPFKQYERTGVLVVRQQ